MDQKYALRYTNTLSPSLISCDQNFQPASNLEGYYRGGGSCAVGADTECQLCSVLTERAKRKESRALPAACECKKKGKRSGLTEERKTLRRRRRRKRGCMHTISRPSVSTRGQQVQDSVCPRRDPRKQ